MSDKMSIAFQPCLLPVAGALLQCLDELQNPIPDKFASGFIRREGERHFLYTCWHVVSGFNPNDVRVNICRPPQRYLKVAIQAANLRQPNAEAVGGLQTVILPLYDSSSEPIRPLWLQDDDHLPHPDLNAIGLYVPFWHDVVKLELPADLPLSQIQVVGESHLDRNLATPGDKCFVVGYPYGFSAFGQQQPTPVVLTRFIASNGVAGRRQQLLLESIGAPGMSGGPVFVERNDEILLLGIYTGLIYPDYNPDYIGKNNEVTALGTVSNLSFLHSGLLTLVAKPSKAAQPPRG